MEDTVAYPYASMETSSLRMDNGPLPFGLCPKTMFADPCQPSSLAMGLTSQGDPMAFPSTLSLQEALDHQDMESFRYIPPSATGSGAPCTSNSAEPKHEDQQQPQPKKHGRPRRKTAKQHADADALPPKRAKASTPPSHKGSTNESDEAPDCGSNRNHLRARNRVAAAKFRERKRE